MISIRNLNNLHLFLEEICVIKKFSVKIIFWVKTLVISFCDDDCQFIFKFHCNFWIFLLSESESESIIGIDWFSRTFGLIFLILLILSFGQLKFKTKFELFCFIESSIIDFEFNVEIPAESIIKMVHTFGPSKKFLKQFKPHYGYF